jgi:hypothetical protein
MNKILYIFLWFLFVAFLLWVTNYVETLRYIFLLRVPIFVGLLLVFLPFIAIYTSAKAFLKNLFVLRSNRQLILVIIATTLAGLATILVSNVILNNAHLRFAVAKVDAIPEFLQHIILSFLVSPIIIFSIILSRYEIQQRVKRNIWIGILSGIGLAIILLLTFNSTQNFLESNDFLNQSIVKIFLILPHSFRKGYIIHYSDHDEAAPGIIPLAAFLLLQLFIYILGYVLGKPQAKSQRFEPPALGYLVIILSVIVMLLGEMSFFLDYSRVPVILLFVFISGVGYYFFNVDHFYNFQETQIPKPGVDEWKQAVGKRLRKYQGEQNQVLIVVCASGGGIQAAGWTAKVLTGLQELIGTEFTQSIGWISSVSGGSVGAMYYLDRFGDEGFPPNNQLKNIFKSSTKDSLDAIGWGLAYPDLLRFVGVPFLVPKMQDRGNAVEVDWRGELKQPNNPPALSHWQKKVTDGTIPIPIFNATQVETGRCFMISPMTFNLPNTDTENAYIDFNTLYPGFDIDITTAARLSASFPYISPVARPNLTYGQKPGNTLGIFHVADGGYFDNYGVGASMQLLEQLLSDQDCQVRKILLLQIHAFPGSPVENNNPGNPGWLMEVIGSIQTLLNVQGPAQSTNNAFSIECLRRKCENGDRGVEIADFIIAFPDKSLSGELEAQPLSWQLTQKQKKAIQEAWEHLSEEDGGVIEKIQQKWQSWVFSRS